MEFETCKRKEYRLSKDNPGRDDEPPASSHEDQELVEACITAIERICPPEYSVRTDQVKQALNVVIPIIRQHYEQREAEAIELAEADAIAKERALTEAAIRQDERERIARDQMRFADTHWSRQGAQTVKSDIKAFFRDRYDIEAGND